MSEREAFFNNHEFPEELIEEITSLRNINNIGRMLLKLGVALAGVFAVKKMSQGNNTEGVSAGALAVVGLLTLTKDPIAWEIDAREAALEEIEERYPLLKS